MTDNADSAAFARVLQQALSDVRASHPESEPMAEERLGQALAGFGLTLTTDVVGALAFAVVHGPESPSPVAEP